MTTLSSASRRLGLEPLESRMLLAGTADPYGLLADFNLAMEAITGTGDFEAAFSTNFGNRQLVISGGAEDDLRIDMDALPDFITNIRISSFDEVTVIGTDKVVTLVLDNIGSLSAPDLAVTNILDANDVARIDLDSIGFMALLVGSETHLSVRVLDGAIVISDLQSLTLNSESANLTFISTNTDQLLHLESVPASIALSGISRDSVGIVPPGGNPGQSGGGSGSGTDSAPVPDDVIVIVQADNEQTRAYIAELRDLLHADTMGMGQDEVIFELQAYASLVSGKFGGTVLVNGVAVAQDAMPFELLDEARILESPAGIDASLFGAADTGEPILPPFGSTSGGRQLVNSNTDHTLDLPPGISAASTMDIDATWPVALPLPYAEAGTAKGIRGGVEDEADGSELKTSMLAFGDYLIERVSSEFLPGGQQSLVLLVDPRPSRPGASNPTSALDLFSRSNRTTLSSIERAMR